MSCVVWRGYENKHRSHSCHNSLGGGWRRGRVAHTVAPCLAAEQWHSLSDTEDHVLVLDALDTAVAAAAREQKVGLTIFTKSALSLSRMQGRAEVSAALELWISVLHLQSHCSIELHSCGCGPRGFLFTLLVLL